MKVSAPKDVLHVIRSIASETGSFFSVTFTKLNGEERKMVGRFGVTKHLKGGVRTALQEDWVIYSVQDKGYRTIKTDNVKSVRIHGIEYQF
jgi:hypothetical protein